MPMSMTGRFRHMNELWKTIGPPVQKAAGVGAFFGDYLGVFAERTTSHRRWMLAGSSAAIRAKVCAPSSQLARAARSPSARSPGKIQI